MGLRRWEGGEALGTDAARIHMPMSADERPPFHHQPMAEQSWQHGGR